jgi:hypothetical protein
MKSELIIIVCSLVGMYGYSAGMDKALFALKWIKNGIMNKHKSDPSISDGISHLQLLPLELQNEIAQYLVFPDRETDEEFIARMQSSEIKDEKQFVKFLNKKIQAIYKENKTASDALVEHALSIITKRDLEVILSLDEYCIKKKFQFSSSPDFSKIMFIIDLWGIRIEPIATVLDLKTGDRKILKFEKRKGNIHTHAISSNGRLVATTEDLIGGDYVLRLKNVQEDRQLWSLSMNHPNKHAVLIGFNKQSTRLMVNYLGGQSKIFSVDKENKTEKVQKILKDYFKLRGVCKKWGSTLE